MKKTLLIILVVLLGRLSFAQTWSALSQEISYDSYNYNYVYALTPYNNNIIAAGLFDSAGTIPVNDFLAQWNGTVWDSLGSNLGTWWSLGDNPGSYIWALTVYHDNLYIGGRFYAVDNIHAYDVIRWNGKSFSAFGGEIINGSVFALTVYNDNLIAAGTFSGSGTNNSVNNIALWNGTSWDTLGSGLSGSPYILSSVYTMAVYNGNLYAAGTFTNAGRKPANNIAMWNGSSWSPLGTGVNGNVYSLTEYNGELYACGDFDSAGGQSANYIAKWNGTTWAALGKGIAKIRGGYVQASLAYNGNLIVGGNFDSTGGVYANNLAAWNGKTWSALTSKRMDRYGYVYALTSYNGNLYVGGSFDSIAGIKANYIAEYCPGNCFASDTVHSTSFKVYPNPGNGVFTFQANSQQLMANGYIEFYNVLGQQVYSQVNIQNPTFTIDLTNYPNGVYFYRVTTGTGTKIANGKLVKQ